MIRVPCDVAAFNASDELCRERRVPVNLGEQMSCAIGADLILCLSAARGGDGLPINLGSFLSWGSILLRLEFASK